VDEDITEPVGQPIGNDRQLEWADFPGTGDERKQYPGLQSPAVFSRS
jgi:hypothetical protein